MKRLSMEPVLHLVRLMGPSRRACPLAACLLAIVSIVGAGSTASAAVVPCPTSTTMDVLFGFNTVSNACFSQDVMYWNFGYVPSGNAPPASGVTADLILQKGGVDMHGWNFGDSWSQAGATPAGFTLSYSIEVCDNPACSLNVAPGTVITAADAVYAPVSVAPAGPAVVDWSNGATVTLSSGIPGPLPSTGNIGLGAGTTGPISVTETFSGTGAITQTSLRFYENIAVIPEPTTASLLGCGLAGLALVGARRSRA